MEVEVAFVLVEFDRVIFAKLVAPVKEFVPEKVLLFARSVLEAPVIALLQPKEPFVYVSAWEALLHAASPAP